MQQYQGPTWDLTSEYQSPQHPQVEEDLKRVTQLLDELCQVNKVLEPYLTQVDNLKDKDRPTVIELLAEIHVTSEEASTLLSNLLVFTNCLLSVDGAREDARLLAGRLTSFEVRLSETIQPAQQFLKTAPDPFIKHYLQDERVHHTEFLLQHNRKLMDRLLPIEQEVLVKALAQDGLHAWSKLYSQLSTTLSCVVSNSEGSRVVGLAEATSLTQSPSDSIREDAWRAINLSWSAHIETCTAAINAIAGWNLELCRRRSSQVSVHYMDAPIHSNHYQMETLDAVMKVTEQSKPLAQRAARALARAYNKEKFGPWDQRAPAPQFSKFDESISFAEGLKIVADSFHSIDPSMGEFVTMMQAKEWIEGSVSDHKRPGAYCTSFAKSRSPRVYMTYAGSMTDVTILAHELGHAFHHWVMRDLPRAQRTYGMSLAETASTFGESLVRDALLARAKTIHEQIQIVWEEIAAIVTFLLNIPTRYEFERNFYDARQDRPLLPDELNRLMRNSWSSWYGDALAEPDELFWINKLHFYFSSQSFYNFPYLFGYLFSQSIYQRREEFGASFFARYKALLMDTGRMTAEDLAQRHLQVDLTDEKFWLSVIAALKPRITYFEDLLDQL